jgi:GNAT superfamily N-acetyltransferase
MIAVERNAPGIEQAYLRGLSTCFPGAWNEASYRWYFDRPFRSLRPDKLTAHDGGRLLAGLGINYRRLRSPAGSVHDVGVLTAAWTLPEYRRRGCYARLLDAAIEVGTTRGCAALVSFAASANPSVDGVRRVGARDVPTRYLSLAPGDPLPRLPPTPSVHALPELAGLPSVRHALAFHYANREEWAAQFAHRPERTTLLEVGSSVAVVEHVATTDRLQFLSPDAGVAAVVAIARRAQSEGRHFFYFTTDEALAEHAAAHGVRVIAGSLLILDLANDAGADLAAAAPPASTAWHVQPGDRM